MTYFDAFKHLPMALHFAGLGHDAHGLNFGAGFFIAFPLKDC
jgi:hypothetical protein